jgi:hypothetical protein
LKLTSILPVSAAAFCRIELAKTPTLLLLQEQKQIAAMSFRGRQLIARDVEPVTRSPDDALFRLMARIKSGIASAEENPIDVAHCSSAFEEPSKALIAAHFADAKIRRIDMRDWL